MEAKSFAYWLQGLFELTDSKTLDEDQTTKIKNHLKLVFIYDIDPSYSDNPIVQAIFQNLHDGKPPMEGMKVIQKPEFKRPPGNGNNVLVKC